MTYYVAQDIDNKDMAKMIIYLMDRNYPCRNLDALVSAFKRVPTTDEYYHDCVYLLGVFESLQKKEDIVINHPLDMMDELERDADNKRFD